MQLGPVMGIAIVLFALSEILKRTIFKDKPEMKAVIPYVCALIGAFIGVCLFLYDPTVMGSSNILEAVVVGAVSGLIATGAFQIYKQFLELVDTAAKVEESVKTGANKELTDDDLQHLSNIADSVSSKLDGESKKTE